MVASTDSTRPASAFVFAPAVFLTVTLERRGSADEVHLHAGGQGLWIARMLATLGVDVAVCGPFAGQRDQVEPLAARIVARPIGHEDRTRHG